MAEVGLDTPGLALSERVRRQLVGLTIIFLLGMAVNLIGLPSEAEGGAKVATMVFLALHVLIGIGLIVGGVVILRLAMKLGSAYGRQARMGSAAIGLTFLSGILTAATDNAWWSYAMAVGFVASFWVYGALYVRVHRAL